MKLNFNPVSQNQIFNAYRINQSAAAKTGKADSAQAQERRLDLEYHGSEKFPDQFGEKGRQVDGFHQVPGGGL